MHFLTCEPHFTSLESSKTTTGAFHDKDQDSSLDEAERFFADPAASVEHYPVEKFSHVVIFDKALEQITKKYFSDKGFSVCARFFNTFFPEERRGMDLYVLCRA